MDNDSYTAVDKNFIDAAASNNTHKHCGKGCSEVSGGYELVNNTKVSNMKSVIGLNNKVDPKTASTFMGVFTEANKIFTSDKYKLEKINYNALLKDVDVIEVCGLAGDYCVRDTVVALAQKFNDKKIVLLGDLTSYPALPFGSINVVPQHVSEEEYKKPDYKADLEKYEVMLNGAFDDKTDKDITLYLMKLNSCGKLTLLEKNELKRAEVNTYFHFITPHAEILADYKAHSNISINISLKKYADKDKYATEHLTQSGLMEDNNTIGSLQSSELGSLPSFGSLSKDDSQSQINVPEFVGTIGKQQSTVSDLSVDE